MASKLFQAISERMPRPFKYIQRKLHIENEWANFKNHLKPHKFKLIFLFTIVSFPVYRPLIKGIENRAKGLIEEQVQKDKPVKNVTENFIKEVVEGVLKDNQIRREGGTLVENLAKRQIVQDAIVRLLIISVKDPEFVSETKILSKKLVDNVIHDKTVEQDAVALFNRVVKDPEVKQEIVEQVKWMFGRDDVREAMVQLFKNGFEDEGLRAAISSALGQGFNEVLTNKDSLEKVRIFFYYLLEKEGSREGSIRDFIDLVLEKAMNKKTLNSKESEFSRIMKGENEQNVLESINDRRAPSKERSKRFFFF